MVSSPARRQRVPPEELLRRSPAYREVLAAAERREAEARAEEVSA